MDTKFSANHSQTTTNPPYYVTALALAVPAILFGFQIWGWHFFISVIKDGYSDFRQLYAAGYMVRTGHGSELYDYAVVKAFQDTLVSPQQFALPFIRPASQALLFVPLSLLRYRTAFCVFLAFNLVLLGLSFWLLRSRMDNLAKVLPILPAAMFVGYFPVGIALMQGQDSILLLTLLAAAVVSLDRGRELTAGVLVGLGLFKFQIIIPIGVLFLVWRRWRFSAGFALAAATLATVSVWLTGFAQAWGYARTLLFMSSSRRLTSGTPLPVDHMPNLHGLIFGLAGTHLSSFSVEATTIILSGVLLISVATLAPGKQRGADALLLAITAGAVVSYYLLIYDLSIVLIPVVLIMNRFIGAEATGNAGERLQVRASALMFTAPAILVFVPYFNAVGLPLCIFLLVLMQRYRRDGTSGIDDGIVSRSAVAPASRCYPR